MPTTITKQHILNYLQEILDPEVPVINIVELGIVRDVVINNQNIEVFITPTYSGCPAMNVIEDNIIAKLKEYGIENLKLTTVLSPAWTTDWLTKEAKQKLKNYSIAPPEKCGNFDTDLISKQTVVKCPRCNSHNTELKSQFGSTACKALYFCKDCLEPFDYFKSH